MDSLPEWCKGAEGADLNSNCANGLGSSPTAATLPTNLKSTESALVPNSFNAG